MAEKGTRNIRARSCRTIASCGSKGFDFVFPLFFILYPVREVCNLFVFLVVGFPVSPLIRQDN